MDVDTSAAIDSLRAEILGVEARLTERIGAGDQLVLSTLRGEMVEMRSELRGEMVAMKLELVDKIADAKTELQVQIESLRDDVRLVAGAVAHLSVKVDNALNR